MSEQIIPNSLDEKRLYFNRYRVVGYLRPKYARLFAAYVNFTDGESESSCMAEMIKKFFDQMPEPERQKMLNYSKNSY